MAHFTPGDAERFWSKVDESGSCLTWTGSHTPDGYGTFWWNGSNKVAHRALYESEIGPVPPNRFVDHICFNRLCVRLTHLRLVSRKENGEHRQGAQVNSRSGVRGVFWEASNQCWRVRVEHNRVKVHGGLFKNLGEAEVAAKNLRQALFTHDDG